MPTSSSAQPMMAFSSPLLSSVDRLLRGFDGRFGSAGFLSTLNRFERFSDRLLGRHLSSLGVPIQSSGFAPRDLPPVPTLDQPESWIAGPTAATAKSSARAQAVSTTAAKPAANRMSAVGMPMVPAASQAVSPAPAATGSSPATTSPALAPSVTSAPTVTPTAAPTVTPTAAPTASSTHPPAVSAASSDVVAPLPRGIAPSERARTILPELSEPARPDPVERAADSDEPRGLDLVLRTAPVPVAQRPPSLELMRLSALARSFQHLGWSDARLGLGQSAPATAAAVPSSAGAGPLTYAALASEPSLLSSARIASGAALAQTMVAPDAIGKRTAPASPSSSRVAASPPVAPAPTPDVARRQDAPGTPTLTGSAAGSLAPAVTFPAASSALPSFDAGLPDAGLPDMGVAAAGSVDASGPAAHSASQIPSIEPVSRETATRPTLADPAVAPSGIAQASAFASSRAMASLVPERTVASSRRAVVAEMADLLGPFTPGLSPSMWLGETVSNERAAASASRTDGRAAPRAQTKPLTAPGQISSKIEQFAAQLGLATGLPLPSPDRPQAAAQWSHAPGLASSVQRLLLAQADSAGAVESRSLPPLPMLAAPAVERAGDKLPSATRTASLVADKAATKLERPIAATGLPTAVIASTDRASGTAGSVTEDHRETAIPRPRAVAPASLDRREAPASDVARAVSADSSASPSVSAFTALSARPWQQLGGVATLAELFAAGVGLSSGTAQRAADSAGLSLAPSVLPSWLALPPRLHQAATEPAPSWASPALSYLAPDATSPVVANRELRTDSASLRKELPAAVNARRESSVELAPARPNQSALPSHASGSASELVVPASLVPALSTAEVLSQNSERPAARLSTEPARWLGQVGGLAASTESFARAHGIARIEELVGPGAAETTAPSRFVSLSGGQVLVSSDVRRQDRAVRGARQAAAETVDSSFSSLASADSPSRLLQPAWQRPGGMALRSELLATQMTGALPWIQPSEAKQWHNAPGVPSRFAQILASTESQDVLPRWAMGPQGLLFVAGPQAEQASSARRAPVERVTGTPSRVAAPSQDIATSRRPSVGVSASSDVLLAPRLFEGSSSLASSVASPVPSQPSHVGSAVALPRPSESVAGSSLAPSVLRSIFGSSAPELPWLRVGGMAALAELFAAGVGVGTGAAQSVAQSLGVSSGRSLTPDWLLSLAERAGSPELAARFSALLPSLVLPSVARPADAKPEAMARPAKTGSVAPASLPAVASDASSTARPSLRSLLTGGLAASAESFARHFGIERIAGSSETNSSTDSVSDEAGRWLSVAGGMVFLPKDQATQPSSDARQEPKHAKKPATPSLPAGQLGATALRSEIFSALLGPQRTLGDVVGRSSLSVLSGWDDLSSLLVSLPKAHESSEPVLPRWGLSGTGGLMFVGAPSLNRARAGSQLQTEQAAAPRRNVAAKNDSAASSLPGSLASLAESVAARSASMAPSAQHIASPLLSLVAGPSKWADARRGVSDVENAYSQRVLTSFPRQTQASGAESTPTSLWPSAMLSQVQRLEKVVSMLPSEWQPSLKVVAALRQSGVAQTPLWQELPKALSTVKPYETADDGESSPSSFAPVSASALRSPSLSMVNRPAQPEPSARPAPVQSEASKQQSVERAMSEAVASLIKSGGQAAASARLLDAIRSQATSQSTRSDDRLNLSDLTMIALSMGQNRIAASSPDHPKERLEPNVGNALRMKHSKHVEDDKNSYRKTVSEHAEQVVKYMKDQLEKSKMRGQF